MYDEKKKHWMIRNVEMEKNSCTQKIRNEKGLKRDVLRRTILGTRGKKETGQDNAEGLHIQ